MLYGTAECLQTYACHIAHVFLTTTAHMAMNRILFYVLLKQ